MTFGASVLKEHHLAGLNLIVAVTSLPQEFIILRLSVRQEVQRE